MHISGDGAVPRFHVIIRADILYRRDYSKPGIMAETRKISADYWPRSFNLLHIKGPNEKFAV